uniref:AlNc14C51G4003 protein n=1 Tax=Albugo laibachii Nc14 TaxID=890382 RepID=F0WBF5_9STRA|nr:AlNc14C51G4003 [Albugo laibachii Nc14]|eukprot:CCA18480.1 AlNc14C51G4003 [Albugo laibachii Nc14]
MRCHKKVPLPEQQVVWRINQVKSLFVQVVACGKPESTEFAFYGIAELHRGINEMVSSFCTLPSTLQMEWFRKLIGVMPFIVKR